VLFLALMAFWRAGAPPVMRPTTKASRPTARARSSRSTKPTRPHPRPRSWHGPDRSGRGRPQSASFGGGTGVVFDSVGNFLHPSLGAQAKNFIGRALYDFHSFKLRQVQVLPVANAGHDVTWSSSVDGAQLQANLRWSQAPAQHGVYANVKP
jgi:hypothetical protein